MADVETEEEPVKEDGGDGDHIQDENESEENPSEGDDEEGEEKNVIDDKSSFQSQLDSITVESPKPTEPVFDPTSFPPSYKDNCPKELQAIWLCKQTLRQTRPLYFDRQPFFLKPHNEFGVEKLVSTTIHPTQLPYKDLLDWPDIAAFVAGYLIYDPLKPAHMLPKSLFAPQTVLERQHGHCFEYSTVLCSMLIGSGYDAFVVSGYATREVCNIDLKYTRCPIIEEDHKVYPNSISLNINRYTKRPPRSLRSEYLLRMDIKADGFKKKLLDEKLELEKTERALKEAPPTDPLKGWRVHSWVMVLKGQRDIEETFFIEPTTGVPHGTDWGEYLGIESLWNHRNYYINSHQEAVHKKVPVTKLTVPAPLLYPPSKMNFDIGDSCNWDFLFHWQDLHRPKTDSEVHEMSEKGNPDELNYELPPSWTKPLYIHRDDYDMEFPTGKKSIRYKAALLEMYAHYLNPDGMIKKLWVYHDMEATDLHYSKETFAHRADLLETRYLEQATGRIIESFATGRSDFIREHHYYVDDDGLLGRRIMEFDKNKRLDDLYKKEEGPDYMKFHFTEYRKDRKYYKEVRFGPKGHIRESNAMKDGRPIESLTERYRRNRAIPANEDIAEVVFDVTTDGIHIGYHVEDHRIVGSTRNFVKPPLWYDVTQILKWSPELHWNFEIDKHVRPKGELELYEMLINLMNMEQQSRNSTRISERETLSLLRGRDKELSSPVLLKNYTQAHRIQETREARLEEKARLKAAIILKKSDILRDYLEPNMHRLGLDVVTNKKQAVKVRQECLGDFRRRLLNQANTMKEDFEKEKNIIVSKQLRYHEKFISMSADEEDDFRTSIMQHMFVAHILEQRISAMKELAVIRYQALIDQIARDPRLEQYLI